MEGDPRTRGKGDGTAGVGGGLVVVWRSDSALHYITLETCLSNNFEDHYGDAATEQCLGI